MRPQESVSKKGCTVCCGVVCFVRGKLKIDGDFFFVHFILFYVAGGESAYYDVFFGTGSKC